jgi:hypothetical protein
MRLPIARFETKMRPICISNTIPQPWLLVNASVFIGSARCRRSAHEHDALAAPANYPNWKLKESRGLAPRGKIIITDAISKAEEIMRKVEKNYPAK